MADTNLKMNKQGLEVAINILSQDIMKALHSKVKPIAKELFTEYNKGPKPRRDQKIILNLGLELKANILYEIEERLKNYVI